MSDLVGNPEDRFSRVAAQLLMQIIVTGKIKSFYIFFIILTRLSAFRGTVLSIKHQTTLVLSKGCNQIISAPSLYELFYMNTIYLLLCIMLTHSRNIYPLTPLYTYSNLMVWDTAG